MSIRVLVPRWTRQLGSAGSDHGYSVVAGANGDLFVAGFTTSADFLGQTSNGIWDGFLCRLSRQGEMLWSRLIGTATVDVVNAIALAADGSVLFTGYTRASLGGQDTLGSEDVLIGNYRIDATPAWFRLVGTSSGDIGKALATGPDGSVYVSGSFSGQGFISRFGADGTAIWTQQPPQLSGGVAAIAVGPDGSLYLTGDAPKGDPDGNSYPFLARYSAAGDQCLWIKSLGIGGGIHNDLVVAGDGSIYLAGGGYGDDYYLSKYSADGTEIWKRILGLDDTPVVSLALQLDPQGNVYVACAAMGDFKDAAGTVLGRGDSVSKFSSAGELLWMCFPEQRGFGASDIYSIAVVGEDSFLVTGKTFGSGPVGGQSQSFGGGDAFVTSYSVATLFPPTDLLLSSNSFDENIELGSVVATLASVDPDSSGLAGYSLVAGDGDSDNASFFVDGGSLRILLVPDFESRSSFSIRMETVDADGFSVARAFQLNVNNLQEGPGAAGVISSSPPDVFQEGVTLVAPVVSADPDGLAADADPAYQWFRNGVPIPAATASSYPVPSGGAGTYRVAITYTDRLGQRTSVESPQRVVAAVIPQDSTAPVVTGIAVQDGTVILSLSEPVILLQGAASGFSVASLDAQNRVTPRLIRALRSDPSDASRLLLSLKGAPPKASLNLRISYSDGGVNQALLAAIRDAAGHPLAPFPERFADTFLASTSAQLASAYERLVLHSTSALSGTGNARANTITGNAANNLLNGGQGADTMIGAAGHDMYGVDHPGDVVIEAIDGGADTVQASISFSLPDHVENLTLTGLDPINGSGNALNNTIRGNRAGNRLDGGGGADLMAGGPGDDIYVIDHPGDVVSELMGAGIETVEASVSVALAANLERLVLTGVQPIDAIGNTLANSITGNAANNVIDGGPGADVLTGLAGADMFRYANLTHSLLSSFDRISDFVIGVDSIDAPMPVSADNLIPLGVLTSLTSALLQKALPASIFVAHAAAVFRVGSPESQQTFLALNDATAGFNASRDAIIEITGFSGGLEDLNLI